MISGVLSATEAALIAVSSGKIHRKIKKGNKRAELVKKLRGNMDKVLGSLLLCNTMINSFATTLSAAIFIDLFGDKGVFYATTLMTVLIVIYAEVLPKILAFNNAEDVSIYCASFIKFIVKIFSPLAYLMRLAAKFSLRLFRIHHDSNATSNSIEELRGAIDLHNPHETEAVQERAMLHSILDLGDVEVAEVMTYRRNIMMIDASMPLEDIIDLVIASPYTRIPLWIDNNDNIVGVLHAKALLRAYVNIKKDDVEVDIITLTNQPWFIPESTTLQEQLEAFRQRKEHFAIVVDEYGALQGIITLEDILEEIVGDISDETDILLEGVWHGRDGSVTTLGTTTIRDLNRKFQWSLPDEEASTIAGLILHEARIIPKVGQVFNIHEFRMKILKRVRNQITRVQIFPPQNISVH